MSEDMVKDGYEDIMNVDISSVAIDLMRRKYEHVPQLKCILHNEQLAFVLVSKFGLLFLLLVKNTCTFGELFLMKLNRHANGC